MTKIKFTIKEGSGLDTEEDMRDFFEETLRPRLLELLKAITQCDFTISNVETRKMGPGDPAPKVTVELEGEARKSTLDFVVEHLRFEYPTYLKDW